MTAISIVIALLQDAAGVTAYTGDERIYPVQPTQATTDAHVIVNIAGGRDEQVLAGAAGYYQNRVRLECISSDAVEAVKLGQACLSALESVTKQTVDGARDVDVIFADTDFTDPTDALALGRRVLDFHVRWRAA